MEEIKEVFQWYSMKLGDIKKQYAMSAVERVPGGWVYWYEDSGVFIPYSEEFRTGELK